MPRRPNYKACEKCGRIFNALGLPNHRANCKGGPSAEVLAVDPAHADATCRARLELCEHNPANATGMARPE